MHRFGKNNEKVQGNVLCSEVCIWEVAQELNLDKRMMREIDLCLKNILAKMVLRVLSKKQR
jgi:heterodisulfide reductase subunit A-like polyferredoxin